MVRILIALVKLVLAFLMGILSMSCQSRVDYGEIISETRTLSSFNKLSVSAGIEVLITQSNQTMVKVEASEKIISLVETSVNNNTLEVRFKKKSKIMNRKKVTVYVSAPSIVEIKSSSGSSVKSENTLSGQNIDLSSSSGSSLHLRLEFDQISADASSGSLIKLDGIALSLTSDSSSGSSIEAKKLTVNQVEAKASSGSSQKLMPKVSLKADASSGSSIDYYHNPAEKSITKSSGASVSDKSKS